jgi:glucokinase
MLLAGDVGGTKSDLAVFDAGTGPREPLARKQFHSAGYPSLEAIVREFLGGIDLSVDRACFGVPGPVVDGHAVTTNLPWTLDEATLARELGLNHVHLLNDLGATAYAIPILGASDLHTLRAGTRAAGGAIAIVAPGTGLGEAFMTWDGHGYVAQPSEGGHVDFAPVTPEQVGLLTFLQGRLDHVSYERVCSGIGIPNIYEYLAAGIVEVDDVAIELKTAPDRTRAVVETALAKRSPLCIATLEMFVSILGSEVGNLALKVLATGGIYLAGGIPRRILPLLEGKAFLDAIQSKGRFSEMLARLPVHVITGDAALIGVANYGLALAAGRARP